MILAQNQVGLQNHTKSNFLEESPCVGHLGTATFFFQPWAAHGHLKASIPMPEENVSLDLLGRLTPSEVLLKHLQEWVCTITFI